MKILEKIWRTGVIGSFLAGTAVLLPIALTVLIIGWIVGKIQGALGPGSMLGDLLTSGGSFIVGPRQELIAFWLGVVLALLGIWLLGVFVKSLARRRIDRLIGGFFESLPFVRSIYNPVSQVVRLLSERGDGKFAGMSVCVCRFGGSGGADLLALLTTSETYIVSGERRQLIYLPTSPVPMSGGLVLVPEASITLLPDMTVDALMRIYFSLGVLAPEAMPRSLRNTMPDEKT